MSQGSIRAGKADILLRIRDQTRVGLSSARRNLSSFALRTSLIGAGLGGTAIGGGRLFSGFIKEFSRVEQLLGRFDSVLGNLSTSSGQFADTLAAKINQSGLAIRDTLSQFQAIGRGQGFSPDQANSISQELTKATEDLIAFDDTIGSSQEAVTKLFAVFTGETEPLRKFGADFRKQALDIEGAAKRFGPAAATLSQSQRETLARLEQFRDRALASGITGQAEREVNTLSARLRGLQAALTDTSAAIGATFGPQVAAITGTISGAVRNVGEFAKQNERLFQLAAVGVPVLAGLAGTFVAVGLGAQVLSFSLAGIVGTATFVLGLGTTIAGVFGPIPLVLAGVTAGFTALALNVGGSRDSIVSALSSLAGRFSGLADIATDTFGAVSDSLVSGDLESAGRIALLGLELAFRESTSGITSVWNGFVDGLVISFDDRFTQMRNIGDSATNYIAKTFANAFKSPGEAAAINAALDTALSDRTSARDRENKQNTSNILEARRQEENSARDRFATLQKEFNERKRIAEESRAAFELDAKSEQKPAVKALEDAVETSKGRTQGTFGGGDVSRQFGVDSDRLKEMVKASRDNVEVGKRILSAIENTAILRYA